jgi:hypothetical protein
VPPVRFENRAVSSVLIVVSCLTLAATQPAHGQSVGRTQTQPTDVSLPSLSQPAPPPPQLDVTIPAETEPRFRGGFADREPPVSTYANYAAPRRRVRLPRPYPPLRVYSGAPVAFRNPLPPLVAYRTSPQARQAARLRPGVHPVAPPQPPPTVAATPIIRLKPRPLVEISPYDPVGIGLGSLRLLPTLEATYGYDDNPNRRIAAAAAGSRMVRGEGTLAVRSDWARHDFQGRMRLGYSEYFDVPSASRPDGDGTFLARYDVTRETTLNVGGRFTLDTLRPGAPAIVSGVASVTATNRPIIFSFGTTAGVTQRFNRLSLTLRGTFDRTLYENVRYSDGSTFEFSRLNYNAFGVVARAAYEISPNLTPFVEGTLDKRIHDSRLDMNNYLRDSRGYAVRGGAQVRISELLRGEASGGYAERDYDDPRLPRLRGPTIDAELIYTPSALTTATLRGATTLNEIAIAGAAGALNRTITAQLSHDFLRNLNLTATGSYFTNDYQGVNLREKGYSAGVRLEYKLTRSISIRGSYLHERLNSSAGFDYTANVFLVGLRLQR